MMMLALLRASWLEFFQSCLAESEEENKCVFVCFFSPLCLNKGLHSRWTPTCERRSSWTGSGRTGQRSSLAARPQTTGRETERQMGCVIFTTANAIVLYNSYFGSWTLHKWLEHRLKLTQMHSEHYKNDAPVFVSWPKPLQSKCL